MLCGLPVPRVAAPIASSREQGTATFPSSFAPSSVGWRPVWPLPIDAPAPMQRLVSSPTSLLPLRVVELPVWIPQSLPRRTKERLASRPPTLLSYGEVALTSHSACLQHPWGYRGRSITRRRIGRFCVLPRWSIYRLTAPGWLDNPLHRRWSGMFRILYPPHSLDCRLLPPWNTRPRQHSTMFHVE